ncbi:MAG: hypothetical protein ACTSU2_12130, partial [Promethearchaeota archaeon]
KYFKGIIEKINDVLIKVIKELDENKLKNKKEVEAYVNKNLKSIPINFDTLNDLALHRNSYDIEKVLLRVDEKLKKLTSLF